MFGPTVIGPCRRVRERFGSPDDGCTGIIMAMCGLEGIGDRDSGRGLPDLLK